MVQETTPELIRKRLHVGGLTPQITAAHLKDRFSSFGAVSDVAELGMDGLGQPRKFTFLSIETTPAQLKKCLNIMSGATWRGARLLIAEAKPTIQEKLSKENNPPMEEVLKKQLKMRKRKRREMGDEVGKEAQDFRMVNEKDYTSKKYWTMTPSNHLVRPLALRPTHPLLPPTTIGISSIKLSRTGKPLRRLPPKRARRRVINPTLWDPTHLTESALLEASPSPWESPKDLDEWVFHAFDEDEDLPEDFELKVEDIAEDEKVIGVWRNKAGETQIVKAKKSLLNLEVAELEGQFSEGADQQDDDEDEEEFENWSEASSDLFGRRDKVERSASPLFGNKTSQVDQAEDAKDSEETEEELDAHRDQTAESFPSLFPIREAQDISEEEMEDEDPVTTTPDEDDIEAESATSSSLFPIRQSSLPPSEESPKQSASPEPIPSSSKTTLSNLVNTSKPKAIIPEEIRAAARAERQRDLGVLAAFLADLEDEPITPASKVGKNEWRGFSESEDDDDDDVSPLQGLTGVPPLRLRGGAPSSSEEGSDEDEESDDEDSDESSDSDSGTDSDSDSSEEMSSDSSASGAEEKANGKDAEMSEFKDQKTQKPSDLKSMFGQNANTSSTRGGGFSLLASLGTDIELDETLDIPLASSVHYINRNTETQLEPLTVTAKALYDPDPTLPLFFPPSLMQSDTAGGAGAAAYQKQNDPAADFGGFWAQETDEEMKKIWEENKLSLTRGWKQRARDGRKQKRRRGGAGDDD